MSNKSTDSVEAILKQIKEITENDSFSTSSVQIDNAKLIDDISVTSSANEKQFNDYSNNDLPILPNEEDPELQYFLMKMSNISGHQIDNLEDAANEFQKLKYDSDMKNNDTQINFHFPDLNSMKSTSLDDVMDMIEVMPDKNFMKDIPMNLMEYFPDNELLFNQNDVLDDISIKEQEERINRIISQQEERNRSILNQTPEQLYTEFNKKPSAFISPIESEQNEIDDLASYLSSQNQPNVFSKIDNSNRQSMNNTIKDSNNFSTISTQTDKTDSKDLTRSSTNKNSKLLNEEKDKFSSPNKSATKSQLSNQSKSISTIEEDTSSKMNKNSMKLNSPIEEEESIGKLSSNHKISSISAIEEESQFSRNSSKQNYNNSSISNKDKSNKIEKDERFDFFNPNNQKEEETEEDIFSFSSSKPSEQYQKSETQPNQQFINDDEIQEEEEDIDIIEKVRQELKMRSESSKIEDSQSISQKQNPSNSKIENKQQISSKNYMPHNDDDYSSENGNETNYSTNKNSDNSSHSNLAEIIAKRNQLENQMDLLKTQNKDLKFAQKDYEQKIASLQHDNEMLSSKLSMQESQIDRLNKANEDIQKVLKQTEDLMNSQSNEISSLIEQRNKLLEIIKTQNVQSEKYEEIISQCNTKQNSLPNNVPQLNTINTPISQQINNQPVSNNTPTKNCLHNYDDSTILDSIIKSVSSKFNPNNDKTDASRNVLDEITQLKESANLPINVRIVNIVNYLSSQLKTADTELTEIKEKLQNSQEKVKKGNIHEKELLSLLQSELNFMSKLSHSTDLQNVLLYRPTLGKSLVLNQDELNELTKHCVMVQKFIDDKIGFYSFEQVSTIAKELDYKVQNPHFQISNETEQIFTLLRTEKFEQIVSYLLSFLSTRLPDETIENDSKIHKFLKEETRIPSNIPAIDYHEIANLFIVQAIMNEILQNHIIDIQSQLIYSSRENQKLTAQLSDHDELKESLEKAFRKLEKYHRKENKIQKVISKEMTQNESIFNSTTLTQSQIQEDNNSSIRKTRRSNSITKETPKSNKKSRSASVENSVSKKNDLTTTIEEFLLQFREIASRLQNRENEMVNFAKEVEDLNNKHQMKYDKQKDTIQQLKKIVKDQQKKIQLVQNEKLNLQNKIVENDKNLDMVKNEINNMMQFHDNLRNLIEKLMKDHLGQMQYLQKGVNRMVKQYQFLFNQYNQKQNSISQIEKQNNLLKSNSKKDKNNFNKALREMENQVESYKKRYESIEEEIRSLRSENEKIILDDQKIRSEYEQQKTELDAARTAIKANDIRFKSMLERYECEKKTLQSQLTAQMMKIQSQSANELKNEQENRNNEIDQIISTAMSYMNSEQPLTNKTPLNIVNSLCSTIKNLIEERDLALIDSGDISNARKLLSIQNGMPISSTISELLNLLRDAQSKIDQIKTTPNVSNNIQTSNSNDWEIWAKRLISGVMGSQTSRTDDQLRSTLEEMVLASVSHRALLFRLQIFREEKKAFLKFDKSLLVVEPRLEMQNNPIFSHLLSHWKIILNTIISIRRMQHVAGCLPINVVKNDQNTVSVFDEDDSLNRKKRHRKRSDFDTKNIQRIISDEMSYPAGFYSDDHQNHHAYSVKSHSRPKTPK